MRDEHDKHASRLRGSISSMMVLARHHYPGEVADTICEHGNAAMTAMDDLDRVHDQLAIKYEQTETYLLSQNRRLQEQLWDLRRKVKQ